MLERLPAVAEKTVEAALELREVGRLAVDTLICKQTGVMQLLF
jgi:hypothetical protein